MPWVGGLEFNPLSSRLQTLFLSENLFYVIFIFIIPVQNFKHFVIASSFRLISTLNNFVKFGRSPAMPQQQERFWCLRCNFCDRCRDDLR